MVHGKIVAAEWKNGSGRVGSGQFGSGRVGSGRVGSGRVGSGESRSLPVPTQASLFFRSAVTIALLTYFTLRFTS